MDENEEKMPRICSWANLYQGKKYDAVQMLGSMKDKQVSDNNLCCVACHYCKRGMILWFVWMQILPVLQVTSTERVLPVVQAFIEIEEYQTYVEDVEVSIRNVA